MSFSSDAPLQTNQLPVSIDFPEDQERFLQVLGLTYKNIADTMNTKEGSVYLPIELASFIQYFPTATSGNTYESLTLRPVYRMTYDLIALNGNAPIPVGITVLAVPANQQITGIVDPTSIRGTATIAGPIYVSLHSANGDVRIDNTAPPAQTIIVENNYASAYTQAQLVFEYTKN